ncbi:MAG: bifunctional metallophosphatase/5'-nucleotidase [Chitinophagales bacterium]|nr:bifunctional metallophosphatase/5'-nucleotidase [Chitinophagales bacterium]
MKLFFSFLLVLSFSIRSAFSEVKDFTILHTSDEHSTLSPIPFTEYLKGQPSPTLGGFARLSTKVNEIRRQKKGEPVLLFSCGDIMGGSPYAWLIPEGKSYEMRLMQRIGYDAVTFGNHEFDYGPDELAKFYERAGFKEQSQVGKTSVIITNMRVPNKTQLSEIKLLPYKIYELENGLKIGVFGLLGKEAYKLAPAHGYVVYEDEIEVAKTTVQKLREEGANVIVELSHSGIEADKIMAQKVKGIDVILGGHDHITTPDPLLIGNTTIVHSGYYLRNLGQLEFSFDTETKKLTRKNTPYLHTLDGNIPEDTSITAIVDEANRKLNRFLSEYTNQRFDSISQVSVTSNFDVAKDADFKETTIGNFIADAMRIEVSKVTGKRVDFAFQGNGVIRGDILVGKEVWSKDKFSLYDMLGIVGLGKGPDMSPGYPLIGCYLTEREIFNVLEVSSLLTELETGADQFFLQVSGIKYNYDPGKSLWGKIPYKNLPLPATKAVKSVQMFTGDSIQDGSDEFVKLDKNSDKLHYIVTDYYVGTFLPYVGTLLPKLKISFKDENGKELTIDECVIHTEDGKEFKSWQSLAQYAQSLKTIPEQYKTTHDRIVKEAGIPLVTWTYTALVILVLLIIWGLKKLFTRKSK